MPYVAEDLLRQADRWRFGEQAKAMQADFDREQEAAEQARKDAARAAEAERATMPTVSTEPVAVQPAPAAPEPPADPASWLPSFASLAEPFTARMSQSGTQQPALSARPATQTSAMPDGSSSAPPADTTERRLIERAPTRPAAGDDPLSWLPSFASLAEPFTARMTPAKPTDALQQTPAPTPSGEPAAMPNAADRRRLSTGEEVNQIIVDGRHDRGDEPLPEIDSRSPEAFIQTATPYARRSEAQGGVPTVLNIAVAANESGWGRASRSMGPPDCFRRARTTRFRRAGLNSC